MPPRTAQEYPEVAQEMRKDDHGVERSEHRYLGEMAPRAVAAPVGCSLTARGRGPL